MEGKEIVPVRENVQLGTLHVAPENVIDRASEIATALAKVIQDRKLYSNISGKKYVKVDGWNTLGALIGVLPREELTVKLENGYEATVELIRTSDGLVVGRGSAICTHDEKNWSNRDDFAVRSMAITRATGKAFRLGFSWIMNLAGYETTPWEEMDGIIEAKPRDVTTTPSPPATNGVDVEALKSRALTDPVSISPTEYWSVAKHYGIDTEQGKQIYAELGNWPDALIKLVDMQEMDCPICGRTLEGGECVHCAEKE